MNIRPQEVTENVERSVRYKGSDGKMHSLASSMNENGAGEPIAASPATVQQPLIVDSRQSEITSDEVIAALQENRQVIYIIDDAKYTHYSRNISIYEGDDGFEIRVLTPGGTFKHSGTEIVIW